MKSTTTYKMGIGLMIFCLLPVVVGMIGSSWFNEGPIAAANKYVSVPKDAGLESVTKIYDKQYEREVNLLHYKVSKPHDHRILIKLDASTGELLFYSDTSKRCTERVSTDVRISLNGAEKIALDFIAKVTNLPGNSKLTNGELLHVQGCGDKMYYEYWFEWNRVINSIGVVGENIRVIVHASSGEVVAYNKQWFEEPPSNTEVRISEKEAAELGRKRLLEELRSWTSPLADQVMEAILRAKISETKLAYVRFSLSSVEDGLAPKGLWLCWIVKYTYTELPEGLEILKGKWFTTYVQATTGEVIFRDAAK